MYDFLERYWQNTVKKRLFLADFSEVAFLKKYFKFIWSGVPSCALYTSKFFSCMFCWRDMGKILTNMGNFGQILISRTIEGFGKKSFKFD